MQVTTVIVGDFDERVLYRVQLCTDGGTTTVLQTDVIGMEEARGDNPAWTIGESLAPPADKTTYDGPSRGLGDTVARVVKVASGGLVKPCGGCGKRQAALNNLVPYKAKEP